VRVPKALARSLAVQLSGVLMLAWLLKLSLEAVALLLFLACTICFLAYGMARRPTDPITREAVVRPSHSRFTTRRILSLISWLCINPLLWVGLRMLFHFSMTIMSIGAIITFFGGLYFILMNNQRGVKS